MNKYYTYIQKIGKGLSIKKMISTYSHVCLFLATSVICLFFSVSGFTQCKADSIVTYHTVAGKHEIASVEYFTYDIKDSLLSNKLIEFQNGKAIPVRENTLSYSKSKGNTILIYESSTWIADRAIFKPTTRLTKTYNKKGILLSEVYSNFIAGDLNLENEAKSEHTYNDAGLLISKAFYRWNKIHNNWDNESLVVFEYLDKNVNESYTYEWDSTNSEWKQKWRNDYSYDSDNSLSETVSYQFENSAWIPDTRTLYGYDTSQVIKGNLVQKWNGTKRGWDNKFYYVFKLNEKSLVDTEVHLSWSGKDWVVDLTLFYVYNDRDELIQILNEKKEIVVDRFCNR